MSNQVTRYDLSQLQGITPKLIDFFTALFATGQTNSNDIGTAAEGTRAIQDATVLTLSPNAAFNNERILALDSSQFTTTDNGPGNTFAVSLVSFIALNGSFQCTFNLAADTNIDLPTSGRIPSSDDGPYPDDAAAAAAGVNVGEWYAKTGGTVVWRQT